MAFTNDKQTPYDLFYLVVFSLSAPESICEGEESIQVCVTLETDIEESVQATIETLDGFATGEKLSSLSQ